jgi:hypothetical protein
MLIDMRTVRHVPHPRFYYEYTDETHTDLASTEDVAFSRDLAYAGTPLFCNWDAWAGHLKTKLVTKPQPIPEDAVPRWIVERGAELRAAGGDTAPPRLRDAWKEKPAGGYVLSPKPNGRPLAATPANGECLGDDPPTLPDGP